MLNVCKNLIDYNQYNQNRNCSFVTIRYEGYYFMYMIIGCYTDATCKIIEFPSYTISNITIYEYNGTNTVTKRYTYKPTT